MITRGIGGEFHLKVVDASTGRVREERRFDNLILDSGLKNFARGNPGGGNIRCEVGTGTKAPEVSDTGLFAKIAQVNFNYTVEGTVPEAPTYRVNDKYTCRFDAGAISNTITEIGVAYANNSMLCRQLILDEQGGASALTVLPNEYLDVSYILWSYPNLNDIQFSFLMDGVRYNCVSRLAEATRRHVSQSSSVLFARAVGMFSCYATQILGGITEKPQGIGVGVDASSNMLPYDDSKPYSWSSSYKFGLSAGNTGSGIGSLYTEDYYGYFARQISFNPVLPKDENTEITLVFTDTIGRYGGN